MKKYSLTKQESDRLNSILSVAQIQEEMFNAITDRYRNFLLTIFKRCGIESEMLQFSRVNIANGELIIDKPKEKKPEEKVEPSSIPEKK